MDELIKQVTAKTGISEEQARAAVNTVLDFVKARLPAPIAGQIENAMSGEGGGIGGSVGDMASKVGGLLG
jgi:uncharacterized protein (DUF2267 family)